MANDYAVWVGIDWADKKNVFALRVCESDKLQCGSFLQRASSIDEWVNSLRKLASGGKVAVALKATGEWGEFFPIEDSPWCYNETAANDFLAPLERRYFSKIETSDWAIE